jgi:hypothetical protein
MHIASATSALVALSLSAAPVSAAEGPKRLIDRFSGIVFFCSPDFKQGWTMSACEEITTEVVRQAEAAGIGIAVLEMTGEPQWMAKSAEAGFDGGNALSVVFQFKGSDKPDGFTALDLNMQVPLDPKPGVEPTKFVTFLNQTTTIDPGEHTDVSVEAATTVWSGTLEFLTKPQ